MALLVNQAELPGDTQTASHVLIRKADADRLHPKPGYVEVLSRKSVWAEGCSP